MAPTFSDFRWLNSGTILLWSGGDDGRFYAIDISTGKTKLVATTWVSISDFRVSAPDRFWYKTADGKTHEVTVPSMKPHAKR